MAAPKKKPSSKKSTRKPASKAAKPKATKPKAAKSKAAKPKKAKPKMPRIEYEDNRKPRWGDEQLIFDGRVLHTFSQLVEDPRTVLDAFQKADWKHWIPNPLKFDGRPWKTRLREVASVLNKAIGRVLIKFKADTEGFRWQILPA